MSDLWPEVARELESPVWALTDDRLPAAIQKKLEEFIPISEPSFSYFVGYIELYLSNYAHAEREWLLRKKIYEKVKRPKVRKKKQDHTEHAGEELKQILHTIIDTYNAILEAGAMSRWLLEKELRHRVGNRFDGLITVRDNNGENRFLLPANYPALNGITNALWTIIDAIDHTQTRGVHEEKTLLEMVGRGRPKEAKSMLVRDIGREYRYILNRVPSEKELSYLFEILFGPRIKFERAIKNWHAEANKTPLQSEKLHNHPK